MPWTIAEHARAVLTQADDLPRSTKLVLQTIAGEDVTTPAPTDRELTYVAKVVSDRPVIHRFSEAEGFARCGLRMSYGAKNALMPYSHAASFAAECEGGCF